MTTGTILIAAGFGASAAILAGRSWPRLWLAAALIGAGAAGAASVGVLAGGAAWDWKSGFRVGGDVLHFRLDALSALFLVLLAAVGAAGTCYAHGYWTDREHPRSAGAGRAWWAALLLSMALVLLSADGREFLIAWELFTIASYFLITLERRNPDARAAGWLYLAASHAATLCLLAFFAALAARTGSWELGPMRGRTDLAPLFWLALAAFGLKAGLFPLHFWLPSAHASAPSHVSAIMSGVTIKLGIYGLVRFSGWLAVPAAAGWAVAGLGVLSAVLGVAFALGQHDLKRLLAYHSVENIGIILIGLGFALIAARRGDALWGQLALAGGLLHVWNHGLFKSLLFFGSGSVGRSTGTREISRLGGLWRRMPWTAGLFALGAAAISGLPPLNGFVSEWLVYLGLFGAANARGGAAFAAVGAAILLAATGALALACFVKVCGVGCLGAPRTEEAGRARECGRWMRGPMLALAGACVVLGLMPAFFWPALARAAQAWNPAWSGPAPPVSLDALGGCQCALAAAAVLGAALLWGRARSRGLRRGRTWDCGYAAPTAQMQYTGGSFAAILVEWFGWILRPERRGQLPAGPFPSGASWEERTPETVLERVAAPAWRTVMGLATAARRLQHGRVQAYLLYLLVGLAALAAVVLAGGAR